MPAKRKASQDATEQHPPAGEHEVESVADPRTTSLHLPSNVTNAGRRWYAVHTYSGYENKVKSQLEARVATMHLQDRIYQVLVPIEDVVEVRNGERRTVKRKVFPSYVLVDMVLDDETWHCVRATPGVTSFVGGSHTEPLPLEEHEIERILKQAKKVEEGGKVPVVMPKFTIGETVHIIDGPFAEFVGQVSEVHPDRNKLTVLVSFFNRETPVELDFLQVEKV